MSFSLLVALTGLCIAQARVYEGSVSGQKFQYLGKFVFDYNPKNTDAHPITVGTINLELDYAGGAKPAGDDDIQMYTYDDGNNDSGEKPSWLAIYGNDKLTCEQKLSYSKGNTAGGVTTYGVPAVFNSTDPSCPYKPCAKITEGISQGVRPRFWYVVIAHSSDCDKPVNIPHYRLEMVNIYDTLTTQLSVDAYGITPTYIAAMTFWLVGLVVHGGAHLREPIANPSLRLFHVSFAFVTLGFILHVVHWVTYSNNGVGFHGIENLANVITIFGTIVLWFVAAFICQGYGISKAMLSENSSTRTFAGVVIGLFSLAYVAFALWYYLGRDEAATSYIYDSVPGLIVLLIQVVYAVWIFYELIKTHQGEDGNLKRNWYVAVGVVFVFFFLSTPVIAIAALFVSPWVQSSVSTIAVIGVNTLVFGSLLLLLFPSLALEIFRLPKKGANFADDVTGYANL